MRKHHRHTSFNSFISRTFGFKLSDIQLDRLDGTIGFSYSLLAEKNCFLLEVKVKSDGEIFHRESKIYNTIGGVNCALGKTILEKVADLEVSLSTLKSRSEEADIRNSVCTIRDLLSKDYSLNKIFLARMGEDILSYRNLTVAFPELYELMIAVGAEEVLATKVVTRLIELIKCDKFLNRVENIRLVQQLLSMFNLEEAVIKEIQYTVPELSDVQKDALLTILLAISNTSDQFKRILFSINQKNIFNQLNTYSSFIEALNRSPVKLNFLSGESRLRNLVEKLDVDADYEILFRSLYFVESENIEQIDKVDRVTLLLKVLSLSDKRFNRVYSDIRRSFKAICSEEQISEILLRLDFNKLSINKWIYLFSLLRSFTSEEEKLRFLSKVLLLKGIPVVNSEVPLTLSASIGLKNLSNRIINDSLRASSCLACLPEIGDFTLKDLFRSILRKGEERRRCDDQDSLISVVITTFNPNVDYLELSLRSIACQTYSNVEVVLVDDCSAPNISKEIKALTDCFPELSIQLVKNERNRGQYVSRNIAIEIAKGRYIAIQDDDDVSHPQRFERQISMLSGSGVKMCFTKHVRYSDEGLLSIDDPRNLLVFGDGPASLIFNRDILKLVGGFKAVRTRGDIDFRTRVQTILGENAIRYLDIPLYYMRSSLKTISSLYEYTHGEKLLFLRKKIEVMCEKKASKQECFGE